MNETTAADHRHAFYLTDSFTGAETGRRFFVSTCTCGATETTAQR